MPDKATAKGAAHEATVKVENSTEDKQLERLPARRTINAWWCPWDDVAMPINQPGMACPMCGATLAGEDAVR